MAEVEEVTLPLDLGCPIHVGQPEPAAADAVDLSLAAVGIAWSLPQVILLLITGVLSDRVDRRLLMIAGDVIRGVAIATIGIMSIGGTLTVTFLGSGPNRQLLLFRLTV